jgi:lysophospholipase L1-like esterase
MRQIKANEYVLLTTPQDSLKCAGWGSLKPIPHQYTLTEDEIDEVNDAITAYNIKLKAIADANGLAFVDVNAFVSSAKTGIKYNGLFPTAEFVRGGIYSLDGVHLTPFGNAMLANEFIKAINAKYGSTIPRIDATGYPGVLFP